MSQGRDTAPKTRGLSDWPRFVRIGLTTAGDLELFARSQPVGIPVSCGLRGLYIQNYTLKTCYNSTLFYLSTRPHTRYGDWQ